jgi:hypothetical protein
MCNNSGESVEHLIFHCLVPIFLVILSWGACGIYFFLVAYDDLGDNLVA